MRKINVLQLIFRLFLTSSKKGPSQGNIINYLLTFHIKKLNNNNFSSKVCVTTPVYTSSIYHKCLDTKASTLFCSGSWYKMSARMTYYGT